MTQPILDLDPNWITEQIDPFGINSSLRRRKLARLSGETLVTAHSRRRG